MISLAISLITFNAIIFFTHLIIAARYDAGRNHFKKNRVNAFISTLKRMILNLGQQIQKTKVELK